MPKLRPRGGDASATDVRHVQALYNRLHLEPGPPFEHLGGGGPQFITASSALKVAGVVRDCGANRVYVFGSGNGEEWNALSTFLPGVAFTGFERSRRSVRYATESAQQCQRDASACPTYVEADAMDKARTFLRDGPAALLDPDRPCTLLYSTAVLGTDFYELLVRLAATSEHFVLGMFDRMWPRAFRTRNGTCAQLVGEVVSRLDTSHERIKIQFRRVHRIPPSLGAYADRGFTELRVRADGNCFFRAICDHFDRCERAWRPSRTCHQALRRDVVRWMHQNLDFDLAARTVRAAIVEGDLQDVRVEDGAHLDDAVAYVGYMADDAVYAGQTEIEATANLVGRTVDVMTEGADGAYELLARYVPRNGDCQPTIYLLHNGKTDRRAHFDLLRKHRYG